MIVGPVENGIMLPSLHPTGDQGQHAGPELTRRPAGRRDPGVTQDAHVRAILVDPCVYPISSADGPVAGDEDIDVVRRALEQRQRGEIVLDRVSGVVQVEHRNQDIRKRVVGDETPRCSIKSAA
jgi:hypothetical protein